MTSLPTNSSSSKSSSSKSSSSSSSEEKVENSDPNLCKHSSRVLRVLGQNPGPMTLSGTNTYLVGIGEERILIDTGEGKEKYAEILKEVIKKEGIKNLKGIIVTHWHYDHTYGLPQIFELFQHQNYNIPVYKYINNNNNNNKEKEKEKEKNNIENQLIEYLIKKISPKFQFQSIKDGDILTVGKGKDETHLECIYTPGHTHDHIALYCKQEKAIFTGDCILGQGTAVFDDLYTYMKSLEKLLKYDCEIMYPGHGPMIEKALAKVQEYINHRNQRESQILQALKNNSQPLSSRELVEIIYVDTPKHLHASAEKNVLNHLSKLLIENKVIQSSNQKYSINTTLSSL